MLREKFIQQSCTASLKYPEQTYVDIMNQVLLLVDFVGFNAVLLRQSQDAVLSRSNVSPTQINPFCLLILEEKQTKKKSKLFFYMIMKKQTPSFLSN